MPFAGEIKVDEIYFGGRCRGKLGRCAAGKIPVFDLLKRGGKLYARVMADTNDKNPDVYYAGAYCYCVHRYLPLI